MLLRSKSKFLSAVLIGAALVIGYLLIRGNEGRLRLPAGSSTPIVSLGDSRGLVLAPDGTIWSWGGQDRGCRF